MFRNWLAISVVAFTLAVATQGRALAQATTASSKAKHEVLNLEHQRFTAMVKADTAQLDKLLGAELTYTHSNALVQDKAAFISDIRTGAIKYLSIEPDAMKAVIFGSVAVVTGGAAVHVIQNGNELTFKIRYTNVHVNRHGSWQMVAWEATRQP